MIPGDRVKFVSQFGVPEKPCAGVLLQYSADKEWALVSWDVDDHEYGKGSWCRVSLISPE